jgi:hypothetical protein
LLRQRVEEAEKELEGMREELGQAQARIETLLEMGDGDEGRSEEGSEEASMAFDKVSWPGRQAVSIPCREAGPLVRWWNSSGSPRYGNKRSGI